MKTFELQPSERILILKKRKENLIAGKGNHPSGKRGEAIERCESGITVAIEELLALPGARH